MELSDCFPRGKGRTLALLFIIYIFILNIINIYAYWSVFDVNALRMVDGWKIFTLLPNSIIYGSALFLSGALFFFRDESIKLRLIHAAPIYKDSYKITSIFTWWNTFFINHDLIILFTIFILCLQLYVTDYYNKWNYITFICFICFVPYYTNYIHHFLQKRISIHYLLCFYLLLAIFYSFASSKEEALKNYYNIDYKFYIPSSQDAQKYFSGETFLKYIGETGKNIIFSTHSNNKIFIINSTSLSHYSLQKYTQKPYILNLGHKYTKEMSLYDFANSILYPGWLDNFINFIAHNNNIPRHYYNKFH